MDDMEWDQFSVEPTIQLISPVIEGHITVTPTELATLQRLEQRLAQQKSLRTADFSERG